MKVNDYYIDMILGQKWAIEVETTQVHLGSDYYETDGEGNLLMKITEPFEQISVETFHYSVPSVRCPYWDFEVRYFRVCNDTITLCINDFEEI